MCVYVRVRARKRSLCANIIKYRNINILICAVTFVIWVNRPGDKITELKTGIFFIDVVLPQYVWVSNEYVLELDFDMRTRI